MKLLLLTSAFCLLVSCKQAPSDPAPSEAEAVKATTTEPETCPHCEAETVLEAAPASSDSIYQLESQWTDDQGKTKPLASLGGNIRVVTMGFTTCQAACPRLLADMRSIQKKIPDELLEKTRFTFISIDPETDTPARLAEYRAENDLDPTRWTLLTGDSDSVRELAVVLGIQLKKAGPGNFAHSNLIIVLNSKGEIVHRQEGLSADPTETVKAIVAAR